jgi:hypothetical protein
MAKCRVCGTPTGLFGDAICEACGTREIEAETIRVTEATRVEQDRFVAAKKAALAARLVRGERVFLYESIYLAVDSVLPEGEDPAQFDIGSLKRAGLSGWEVIGVVPRTVGVGLKNELLPSGVASWGGGAGGNVVGVYLLLKSEVTAVDEEDAADLLARYLKFNKALFERNDD